MKQRTYPNRKLLRTGEGLWTRLESAVNRLTGPTYNPLYHLGTLTIYLFIVLLVTGIYLTLVYRPGTEVAYASVERISGNWFGSLMRTVHRYASDGLTIVVALHLLKTLLSERFWGSRWFAWFSGFALLGISWLIGTMGYFLIWDKQAQWMTEYGLDIVRGPVAQTFLEGNVAARTYSFFVIVLFLHVFLGLLIVFGVLLHVIRLNRAKFWAPRWLMIETGIVLAALSIVRPISSNPPANLDQMIGHVVFDGWYFGFMLLVESYGNFLVWGISLFLIGLGLAWPWLAKGKTELGPAIIVNEACTGCTLCAVECPYHAIEMVERNDDTPFKLLAIVKANLCTSCGICVGSCATDANQFAGLSSFSVKENLLSTIREHAHDGQTPLVAFTCRRHETLGTFPLQMGVSPNGLGVSPTRLGASRTRLGVATTPVVVTAQTGGRFPRPVIRCSLPCVGYLPPSWEDEVLASGAAEAVVVSCPAYDCSSREGVRWLAERSRRKRALEHTHHRWVEAAPGDRDTVDDFFQKLAGEKSTFTLPHFLQKRLPHPSAWFAGLLLLLVTFGLSLVPVYPVTVTPPQEGAVRVVLVYKGVVKTTLDNLQGFQSTLPPGVSPEQFMGGERYPVQVQLEVDGEIVLDETFQPGGIRHESAIYGFANWRLPLGNITCAFWLKMTTVIFVPHLMKS